MGMFSSFTPPEVLKQEFTNVPVQRAVQASQEQPIRNISPAAATEGTVRITYNSEADDAIALHNFSISLHPGTEHRSDSAPEGTEEQHCQALIYRALQSLPQSHAEALQHLTLFYTDDGRRGYGGSKTILLRCTSVTDEELTGVFIHELGHVVDTGLMSGTPDSGASAFTDFGQPIYNNDKSLGYYEISWQDNETNHANSTEMDFCSRYSAGDPFEDFAECYFFYRAHGSLFRHYAQSSPAMQQKYEFMKNQVFEGQEFGYDEVHNENPQERSYDSTILPYDLNLLWSRV